MSTQNNKPKKMRRDVAEIAREDLKKIIGEKLNEAPLEKADPEKSDTRNQAAVELGWPGGHKGAWRGLRSCRRLVVVK